MQPTGHGPRGDSAAPIRAAPFRDVSVGVAASAAARLAESGLVPAGTRVNIGHLGDETMPQRLAAIRAVARAGLIPVPHLSARRFPSGAALSQYLREARRAGAGPEVFVIGGDPVRPAGPYTDALALLGSAEFRAGGIESVGIGAHPDGHPLINDPTLWHALENKLALLAHDGRRASIITQLSTDPASVLAWIDEARRRGIAAPVSVGLPGPLPAGATVQYPRRATAPSHGTAPLAAVGTGSSIPPADFRQRSEAGIDPLRHGAVGLHVFGLGDPVDTARELGAMLANSNCQ
jgi:methylenetetrahydrofolate reductase (NADPH)